MLTFYRLMALLELASASDFTCERLVACLDRDAESKDELEDLTRDLGWVGFEPVTLEAWSPGMVEVTSPRWLLLAMEV